MHNKILYDARKMSGYVSVIATNIVTLMDKTKVDNAVAKGKMAIEANTLTIGKTSKIYRDLRL